MAKAISAVYEQWNRAKWSLAAEVKEQMKRVNAEVDGELESV